MHRGNRAAGRGGQGASPAFRLPSARRLGRRFRDMLNSDDADERARGVALFAAAPDELIRALCNAELAGLLGDVKARRLAGRRARGQQLTSGRGTRR